MSGHRQPLTAAEQEWIAQRKKEGKTLQEIAEELDCSRYTVRKYWRRQRDQQATRRPGRPRQGTLSSYAPEIQETAVRMKREHPGWGALTVRLHLAQALGKDVKELPSAARLAVLFKEQCPEAVQARRKRAYPEQAPSKVSRPHQRWQMDAQEGLSVVPGETVNLLNIRDPMGLMIGSKAFLTTTEKRWRKITLREIQQALRQAFAEWGLPDEIQTDHETVYVGSGDENYPSRFTLWLAGLGVTHCTSRPARPTDQAAVEREHRTLADMTWKAQSFSDLEPLQRALDNTRRFYNHTYPSRAAQCNGHAPLQAYPSARSSGRPFDPAQEWWLFDLERAHRFVSRYLAVRQVSQNGRVSVLGHYYTVGAQFVGQTISAQFEPETRSFRFRTQQGETIKTLPARGLDKEDILGFALAELPAPEPFQLPLPIPLPGV
ncbi:MAG: integrase core domain-containing protein [Chloroflexota bacterium]